MIKVLNQASTVRCARKTLASTACLRASKLTLPCARSGWSKFCFCRIDTIFAERKRSQTDAISHFIPRTRNANAQWGKHRTAKFDLLTNQGTAANVHRVGNGIFSLKFALFHFRVRSAVPKIPKMKRRADASMRDCGNPATIEQVPQFETNLPGTFQQRPTSGMHSKA